MCSSKEYTAEDRERILRETETGWVTRYKVVTRACKSAIALFPYEPGTYVSTSEWGEYSMGAPHGFHVYNSVEMAQDFKEILECSYNTAGDSIDPHNQFVIVRVFCRADTLITGGPGYQSLPGGRIETATEEVYGTMKILKEDWIESGLPYDEPSGIGESHANPTEPGDMPVSVEGDQLCHAQ